MYVHITIDLSVLNIDRYANGYSVVCWWRMSSYNLLLMWSVAGWTPVTMMNVTSDCGHPQGHQWHHCGYLPVVAEEKVDIDAFKAWFQKMKEARDTTPAWCQGGKTTRLRILLDHDLCQYDLWQYHWLNICQRKDLVYSGKLQTEVWWIYPMGTLLLQVADLLEQLKQSIGLLAPFIEWPPMHNSIILYIIYT